MTNSLLRVHPDQKQLQTYILSEKKAAIAAVPLGLGSMMTTKAETVKQSSMAVSMAQNDLTDALQLALVLEYLENEYYNIGLSAPGLIPAKDRTVFMQISKHESAHVSFLKNTLTSWEPLLVTNQPSTLQQKVNFLHLRIIVSFLFWLRLSKIPG